jgi:hypothetical protein
MGNQDGIQGAQLGLKLFIKQIVEALNDYDFVCQGKFLVHYDVVFFAEANCLESFFVGALENVKS